MNVRPLIIGVLLILVLDVGSAESIIVREESENIAVFSEAPFYGMFSTVTVSLSTKKTKDKVVRMIRLAVSRNNESSEGNTTINENDWGRLIEAYDALVATFPEDKEKGNQGKKITCLYDINSDASVGYYFGYEFDSGWWLFVGDQHLWIDDMRLGEFRSFLVEVQHKI
jgi:hypothetical protein